MVKFKVTFSPDNKTVEVAKDTTVLSAAISADVYINSACGGDGVCGRCKVKIKNGQVLQQTSGHISNDEKKNGIYLACASLIQSDIEVEVLPESRLSLEGLTPKERAERIKNDYSAPEEAGYLQSQAIESFRFFPVTRKIFLELPVPSLDDQASDLDRLERELQRKYKISASRISLAIIKNLGELLRSADWKVTITLGRREKAEEIILIEPQDTSSQNFGACFDIGTTTVSAQLVDLNSKKIIGTKTTYNKQAAFGSDIITRIIAAGKAEGLRELHLAVVEDMNEMIRQLTREHDVDLNNVTCVVCAGNTTMMHLLLRVDPTYIRREPYVPTLNFVPVMRAQEAELWINPRGLLFCLPGVASYVGADVTAGVLSSGLYKQHDPGILIDIGTNGEVVVGNSDFIMSCAASAGPAFEGSGVSCGMRAAKGAIQKIQIIGKERK